MQSTHEAHRDRSQKAVVVLVTYGRRLALVQSVVAGFETSDAVARIVVVDNGSAEPVQAAGIASRHPVTVVRSEHNLGSAGGFALGIEQALACEDAGFLAIMDDDNLGEGRYIDTLIALHAEHAGAGRVAFTALRSDRPEYRRLLQDSATPSRLENSFMGFHVGNHLRRLGRKLLRRAAPSGGPVRLREVTRAPYGGLFMTLDDARRVGLPNREFVLYGDDHEYTRRMVSLGIRLYLTDHAQIKDIDTSWNLSAKRGAHWIDPQAPGWKIYYAARNQHFLERTEGDVGPMLALNRWVLTALLLVESLVRNRSVRAAVAATRPFRRAIADARQGKLGPRPDYRLPG